MRKGSNGGTENPKPKILGGIPLQVNEGDAARLVGGIVEKGFSDNKKTRSFGPSAEPRPSVLPFPVARHRSHGPHWTPKVESFHAVNENDDTEEDGGEDEDCDGMELVADVANPIQRKEKKVLDFRQWQEIVKAEGNSVHHKKKKERHLIASDIGHKVSERTADDLGMQIAEPEDVKLSRDRASFGSNNETQEKFSMHIVQKSCMDSDFAEQKLARDGEGSLKSQIDSENRARLAKMSSDEIAEAQAEIMSKLNPELIKALKKRGLDKVKRPEPSLSYSTGSEANDAQHDEYTTNSKGRTDNSESDKSVKVGPGDTLKDKIPSNIRSKNSSAWDTWSKRVECVRDMRFSLDGNMISSGIVNISDTGDGSSESGYNPNNVSERDFLRTEGDPGAAGYTIKEAVALTRSVVPGQRALALQLLATILDRATHNICQYHVGSASRCSDAEESVDWEAIWAFALGPEPELALSLRMALDDNHSSVVLSCAKAIHCALCCDTNDLTFDILEKTPTSSGDICTAPVFRSKPDINAGFLRGGFWKYNAKPSNILCFGEESTEEKDGDEHTIKDDVVVAGQDFAAGLVRMGILPRICYLLETDPAAPLEECLISILIAISRHSPTCTAAVMDCGRLVQTVASRFTLKEQMGINACMIKAVTLIKVLAQLEKNCVVFIKNGILRQLTWHLFRHPLSIDQWVKSGKEACKLSSALLVEQLRLWKVFIHYGYCISDFPDLFASLCVWLSIPKIEKLIDNEVMNEYCAITKEVYLLLGDVAGRLPSFYLQIHERTDNAAHDEENWLWGQFGSIIDQALEWIMVQRIPHLSGLFNCQNKDGESHGLKDSEINSLLWVMSSVLNMLSRVLNAVIPADTVNFQHDCLPWLPDFVPRLGLGIIKHRYIRVSGVSNPTLSDFYSKNSSIVDYLCDLRANKGLELAISSTCCLEGLVQVIVSVDKLIRHAKLKILDPASIIREISWEDEALANGLFNSGAVEIHDLLGSLMMLITNEWQHIQSVEKFGRGGLAPGVGVGWGAPNGGYWSLHSLLIQQDARLLACLLEVSEMPFRKDPSEPEQINHAMQMLNCALAACLIVCPGNNPVIDKILTFIFQVPVLKCLGFGISQFLSNRKGYSPFSWYYKEDELLVFANVLTAHFRNRWLSVKKKRNVNSKGNHVSQKPVMKGTRPLETIHEDSDAPNTVGEVTTSSGLEWAYQRLPLPAHWFLSAISSVQCEKSASPPGTSVETLPSNFLKIAKAGLFFLLGVEAIPTFLGSKIRSPVRHVPIVWKVHAMSVLLLSGMSVLEDEKNRDVYDTLQNIYGETVDEITSNLDGSSRVNSLEFESDIHENYSTFIEMLVEQFAADSYGDMLFGRQVAVYLHRSVEASVRLSTWNALSNARILELLPPLTQCCTKAEGYLEPAEDNEQILESYVKSWVSGALDKAATRKSVAFSLVLHHLASFIFGNVSGNMLSLHSKLVKSLIRDYSRKQQREVMMVRLICYEKPNTMAQQEPGPASPPVSEIERRLQLLKEIGNWNVETLQKLESCVKRELNSKGMKLPEQVLSLS